MTENTGDTGDQAGDAGDVSNADNKSIMGAGDDAGTQNETGDSKSIMGAGDTGDGTTDGDKAAADKIAADKVAADKAAADKASEGAPEAYTDFTLPEGMTNDGETTGVFKEMAKDFNLSQEKAQKLVDFYVEGITAVVKDQAQRTDSQSKEETAAWRKETKEDPDIGGANYEASVVTGMRAVKAYGGEAFVNMLNSSKIGNHPEMVRFLKKVGDDVSEDQIVHGHHDQVAKLTAGEIMYPTMTK